MDNNYIIGIYEEIFALDTAEKQVEALRSWYAYLDSTCTTEQPCVECVRELEAQGKGL